MNGRSWALCIAIALPLLVEGTVRASRVTDVPLYHADATIGYIPKPDQSGAFLWMHSWAFNELSMGTARPFRPKPGREDVLLIGDSLVLGGNPYRQEERLGPQLEQATGWTVWPISAGSWGLQNELTYLKLHPEVVRNVDRIVLVSNDGDYDMPSSWQSEMTHPRERQWSRAWYLLQRTVLLPAAPPPPMPVKQWPDLLGAYRRILANTGKPIDVFFYPNKKEASAPGACGHHPVAFEAAPHVRWHCVANHPGWTARYYRDDIHPTAQGTATLARIIKTDVTND